MEISLKPLSRFRGPLLLTVVALAATVWLVATRFSTERPADGFSSQLQLSSLDIDFEQAPHTLVLFLQQGCPFCQDSLPFYRSLIDARGRSGVPIQIAVAAPRRDIGIVDYLAELEFVPDLVAFTDAEDLPIRITPTLLLADSEGAVTRMWARSAVFGRQNENFDPKYSGTIRNK